MTDAEVAGVYRCVRGFLARKCGTEFEDSVQDAVLAVLVAHRAGKIHSGKPSVYAHGVAHYTYTHLVERTVRERRRRAPLTDRPSTAAWASPECTALARESEDLVALALSVMPPDFRDVWELELSGRTQAEICAALGITETQYRLRKSRGKMAAAAELS
jgi:DNA-directed RNA polymerase specialized sigma24 family protein